MRSQLKFVLITAALSVSAGGNARTAYAAPPTDACSLLTPAQVSAVLGSPVSGGPFTQNSKTICAWPAPGGAVPPKRVMVNITHVSVFAGAKMGLAGENEAITPLSGVGDEAFYDGDKAGRGTALFVRKGDFAFSVKVFGFPPDQIKEKEKTLAQDALAKL